MPDDTAPAAPTRTYVAPTFKVIKFEPEAKDYYQAGEGVGRGGSTYNLSDS
jgi:hypothetical protein